VVSVLNIQIPLEMGRLVNVVAGFTPGGSLGTYLERLSLPALHLSGLYLTQGLFTFLYISFLSHLGERLSTRLRTSLFHSLLQSHISFFDTHRTGELVNRLTADVQDFKSSFKMVISQGLRSTTQTLGCFVSLYLISPHMAGVVAVALPVIIGVGSNWCHLETMVTTGTTTGCCIYVCSRGGSEQCENSAGICHGGL
jgi:ATP-binding cassette subfamily B (MDR/TAP) protein 8